jgi:pyruvate/2-oxoglutarate dehydrogenase complex dihydrolipoamide acyltransferase (E2) component
MEQHLVQVMVWSSSAMPTVTKAHIATLVLHINLRQGINIAANGGQLTVEKMLILFIISSSLVYRVENIIKVRWLIISLF